jgi:hypothetical protein
MSELPPVPAPCALPALPALPNDVVLVVDDDSEDDEPPLPSAAPNYLKFVWLMDYREQLR